MDLVLYRNVLAYLECGSYLGLRCERLGSRARDDHDMDILTNNQKYLLRL